MTSPPLTHVLDKLVESDLSFVLKECFHFSGLQEDGIKVLLKNAISVSDQYHDRWKARGGAEEELYSIAEQRMKAYHCLDMLESYKLIRRVEVRSMDFDLPSFEGIFIH